MTDNDLVVTPLVLTDDEVMALAALSGRAWWTGLSSVDATSNKDMTTAAARGLRSLAVRSLLTGDGTPERALVTAVRCLGQRPWAIVAQVDGEDRVVDDTPMLLCFRDEGERLVACRSDVSGTHLFHEIELAHAVELIADQLTAVGGADVAAAFWTTDLRSRGGLRRNANRCLVVGTDDDERIQASLDSAGSSVADVVRSLWTP
jgi:hypothetical protein